MYYIYKITNLINNKIYVGRGTVRTKTYGPEKDHYFGSGRIIKKAIQKYGKENFKKEILEYCETMEEAIHKEPEWIKNLNAAKSDTGYNLTTDSSGFSSETGRIANELAQLWYENLSKEDKEVYHNKLKEIQQQRKEQTRENSRLMWEKRSEEAIENIKQKLSDSWTPEMREAQRQRMLGSKRKNNLEYMVAKYGEEEGKKQYDAWRERNIQATKSLDRRAATQKGKELKAKCPLYTSLNKEVNQPKATVTKLLKSGKITREEADIRYQKIQKRYLELIEALNKWKETNA